MTRPPRFVWIAAAAAGAMAIVTAAVLAAAPGPQPGVRTALGFPGGSASIAPPPTTGSTNGSGPNSGARTMAPTARPRPSTQRTNAGDATHPGDGNWVVGSTAANHVIVSGTYETTVPAGSPGCTWTRWALNHTIITTGHASRGQHATVTIAATDSLFNTKGCGEWHRV